MEGEGTQGLDGCGNVIAVKLIIEWVVGWKSETLIVTEGRWASIDEETECWRAVVAVKTYCQLEVVGLFCQSPLLISSLKIGYL